MPVITLAWPGCAAHVPDDGDWPVVLVQGDTGPGNFMFDGDRLVAVTDWELAHWGDLHDDLAWLLVRDTLERFPDLDDRLRRLRARRAATGSTPRGCATSACSPSAARPSARSPACAAHDGRRRDRLAADLQHAAHAAARRGARRRPRAVRSRRRRPMHRARRPTASVVGLRRRPRRPARRRAPRARRRLRRDAGQGRSRASSSTSARPTASGPASTTQERDELGALLGRAGRRRRRRAARGLCTAIEQGALGRAAPSSPYCLRQAARDTAIMRPAMGSLADRHFTPVRQLAGGHDAVTDRTPTSGV